MQPTVASRARGSQIYGLDALSALAIAGREVQGIDLGTSVFHLPAPPFPRELGADHAGGVRWPADTRHRLVASSVHRNMWGYDLPKPARHMREYYPRCSLLRDKSVTSRRDSQGHGVSCKTGDVPRRPCAGRMARACSSSRQGRGRTITWMTGPKTIAPTLLPPHEGSGRSRTRGAAHRLCTPDVGHSRTSRLRESARPTRSRSTVSCRRKERCSDREGDEGPCGLGDRRRRGFGSRPDRRPVRGRA